MTWTDVRSLMILGVTFFSITLVLVTSYVFVRNRKTPVIKSSYKELHYIILCGTILLYSGSFPSVAKPNSLVCVLAKILPCFGMTFIYVPVLLMTRHIAGLLEQSEKQHPNFNLRLGSLKAQVAKCTYLHTRIRCIFIHFT